MAGTKKKLLAKNIKLGDKILRLFREIEKYIIRHVFHVSHKPRSPITSHNKKKNYITKKKHKTKVKIHPHETIQLVKRIVQPVEEHKIDTEEIPIEKPIPEKVSLTGILSNLKFDNHMKILVVEDEEVLSKVMEEKFEKTNLNVKIATDGESALAYAQSFKPNIILLDINIPKIDGFGVLKALKEKQETRDIPVIVASNLYEDTNITQALKLGANDYFVKSHHPVKEIVEKVKDALLNSKLN